jgi:hypothetical protein
MGDCNICIGGGDYDGAWDFCSVSVVKARKPHKCCECGRGISIGTQYEKIAGKFDGDFSEAKSCLDCMNICNGLACGSVGLGNLWDEIYQIFGEVTTGCLAKIKTPSAKDYFLERWQVWKGLKPRVTA